MKKIALLIVALLITAVINYILFVPSSPVNLMLYLIADNNDFFLMTDLLLSNLIFLGIYNALKSVGFLAKRSSSEWYNTKEGH